MKFTLLHPSRGRAQKARETAMYWIEKSSGKHEIEHIYSLDSSDPDVSKYKTINHLMVNDNSCVVEATNHAAKTATGDILIYLSDDFKCPDKWDLEIIQQLQLKLDRDDGLWLLKVDDCLQAFPVPVLTIPIMSRELYKRLGYFWYPEYRSMFVDEDLYWVTRTNGWMIEAPELKFPHEHCTLGLAERDETYMRSERNWDQGKALFAKRRAAGFAL